MNTIDADGHIVEKDVDIRKYLPEPYAKRGGPLLPSDGLDTGMGGRVGGMEGNDIPTRLKDMDKEGIDVSVLFPTSSFAVAGFMERDYAVAYARAYNDFISNVCKASPRLKGVAQRAPNNRVRTEKSTNAERALPLVFVCRWRVGTVCQLSPAKFLYRLHCGR